MKEQKKILFIKATYWIGAVADALWAVALWIPGVFRILTGEPDLNTDFNMLQIMRIGGVLMCSWTVLLVWGSLKPIERRGILLITVFPAISGLIIIVLIGLFNGDKANIWLLFKTVSLFLLMVISFMFAENISKKKKE